jgi:hypothetical protein
VPQISQLRARKCCWHSMSPLNKQRAQRSGQMMTPHDATRLDFSLGMNRKLVTNENQRYGTKRWLKRLQRKDEPTWQ